MNIKEISHGSDAWRSAVKLREQVLREPLGQTFSEAELIEESTHIHIAGYLHNELIATAVLVPEKGAVKMQRVAVSPQYRNKDLGSKLMQFCKSKAAELGYSLIYCHARDTAVNFYKKNEYTTEGDYFDEDGIPHVKMQKILKISHESHSQ